MSGWDDIEEDGARERLARAEAARMPAPWGPIWADESIPLPCEPWRRRCVGYRSPAEMVHAVLMYRSDDTGPGSAPYDGRVDIYEWAYRAGYRWPEENDREPHCYPAGANAAERMLRWFMSAWPEHAARIEGGNEK